MMILRRGVKPLIGTGRGMCFCRDPSSTGSQGKMSLSESDLHLKRPSQGYLQAIWWLFGETIQKERQRQANRRDHHVTTEPGRCEAWGVMDEKRGQGTYQCSACAFIPRAYIQKHLARPPTHSLTIVGLVSISDLTFTHFSSQ